MAHLGRKMASGGLGLELSVWESYKDDLAFQ